MKIFLLVISILLLILRIRQTPKHISKSVYIRSVEKSVDDYIEVIENQTKKENATMKVFSTAICIVIDLFYVWYYWYIGSKFQPLLALSVIQIVTVIISFVFAAKQGLYSTDVNTYKFRRWYFLFNVLVDYIYYPMAIYLLMTM